MNAQPLLMLPWNINSLCCGKSFPTSLMFLVSQFWTFSPYKQLWRWQIERGRIPFLSHFTDRLVYQDWTLSSLRACWKMLMANHSDTESLGRLDSLVRQPQPIGTGNHVSHAGCVRHLASRIPVVVLSHIPLKVLPTDVVVRAIQGPLQLREESFGPVGGDVAPHVLTISVIHRLMRHELLTDLKVVPSLVGIERAA